MGVVVVVFGEDENGGDECLFRVGGGVELLLRAAAKEFVLDVV